MPPQVRKLMNYTFLMQSWIHLLAYYHKWVQIFIWRKNCFLQGWTQFWELSRGRLGTRYWQQRTHTTRWEIPAAGLFKCSQVRLMSLRSCNVISSISICTNFYISKHWIHETVSHLSRYYATVPFLKLGHVRELQIQFPIKDESELTEAMTSCLEKYPNIKVVILGKSQIYKICKDISVMLI